MIVGNNLYSQQQALQLSKKSGEILDIAKFELAGLNDFYGRTFKIQETTGKIQAKQPATILINSSTLANYTAGLPEQEFRLIVRLVIAHEFIHLLQLESNEARLYTATRHQRKILEAQADILAARYAILISYKDTSIENFKGLDLSDQHFITAYKFFFDIGTATFSISDHPSQFQRATCIYRGMRYANIELLDMAYAKKKKNLKTEKVSLGKIKRKIDEEKLNINANVYKESFSWSLNQAELICHGSPAFMSHLVRGRIEQKVKKVNGKSRVIVSFSLINTSDIPLEFQYEGRIARDRSDATLSFFDKIDFFKGAFLKVLIPARRSVIIDGDIEIPPGSTGKELILPPDSNSLYSVKAADEKRSGSSTTGDSLNFSGDIAELNLNSYLETLNSAIANTDIRFVVSSIGSPSYLIYPLYKQYFDVATPTGQDLLCRIGYDRRVEPKDYMIELSFGLNLDSLASVKLFDSCQIRLQNFFKSDRTDKKNVGWYSYFTSKNYPGNLICLQRERHLDNYYSVQPDIRINGKKQVIGKRKKYYKIYLTIRKKQFEGDNNAIEEISDMDLDWIDKD